MLTLVYGFGLGGVFGIWEHNIKDHLKAEGEKALDTKYEGDEAKMKKVTDKSWVYFKRAHLHANGLGAACLGLILLMATLNVCNRTKKFTALVLGVGSLGYSLCWMLAGLRATGMGGTGAAKESLAWLAFPSGGLCMLGLASVIVSAGITYFGKQGGESQKPSD